MSKLWFMVLLLFTLSSAQGYYRFNREFSGLCIKVYSHQTISVKQGRGGVRIRLYDVGQELYPQGADMSAQEYLELLVLDKEVRVVMRSGSSSTNPYAEVYVSGRSVSRALIDAGYAESLSNPTEKKKEAPLIGLPKQTIGLPAQPIGLQ